MPAELRNHIYSLALEEETQICINSRPVQPGLLRVNRQIKTEASAFFYRNQFVAIVYDLEPAPQFDHWLWAKLGGDSLRFEFRGQWDWRNLKVWLKAFHQGRAPSLGTDSTGEAEIVWQAFELVNALRGTGWETVEKVLEPFRVAVEVACDGLSFFQA